MGPSPYGPQGHGKSPIRVTVEVSLGDSDVGVYPFLMNTSSSLRFPDPYHPCSLKLQSGPEDRWRQRDGK